ncbi:MAG: DNA polymerase III subunit chi [Steroidobacteraceae bacterium]
MPRPRVDFYITDDASGRERLRLACRLAEKAYQAGQAVVVLCADAEQQRALDELMWTFRDGSFLPHECADSVAPVEPRCVRLQLDADNAGEIVISLSETFVAAADSCERVIDIIDGDADRRARGRERFRSYRELGLEPATQQLRGRSAH